MVSNAVTMRSPGGNTRLFAVVRGSDVYRNLILAGFREERPVAPEEEYPVSEPADEVTEDTSDEG